MKRILAMLLALTLTLSCIPALQISALATDEDLSAVVENISEETIPEEPVLEEIVPEESLPAEPESNEEAPEVTWEETTASAEAAASSEGITWDLSDGVLTISGSGTVEKNTSISKSDVKSIVIGEGITEIGEEAFQAYTMVENVRFPDSLIKIGKSAFYSCLSLTSITIPDNVAVVADNAFYNCVKLTNVVIGDGVTSIGSFAFMSCPEIASVTFGKSIANINKGAFWSCGKLTSLTIPGNGVSISESAFRACTNLTSVTFSGGAGMISRYAFAECSSLTSVDLGNSTTKGIYGSAFSGCSSLREFVIPDSVERIEDEAFLGCTSLTKITIPDNVTYIGRKVFAGCTAVTTVNFNATNCETVGYGDYDTFRDCSSLTEVNIGSNVRSIPANAFRRCSGLISVTIPEGVTSIDGGAFMGCTGLTSVFIPASVTQISTDAFYDCPALSHVLFAGTENSWDGISIYDTKIPNVKRHYQAEASDIIPWSQEDCTKDIVQKCTICGDVLYYPIEGGEHSYQRGVTTQPTCTEKGYTPHTCEICGDQYLTNVVEAKGHQYATTITKPTCNSIGYTTYTCGCGSTYVGDLIMPTGHAYQKEVVAPTYTKPGYIQYTCGCGDAYRTDYTYALGLPAPTCDIRNDEATGKPVITWNEVEEADHYTIYRSDYENGAYTKLGTTSETVYVDHTAATLGKTYYYKLEANSNASGTLNSDRSNAVGITYVCAQPEVTVSKNAKGNPVLSWEKVEGAKKYEVYMATTEDGDYKKLTTTTKLTYTYSASAGKEYYFKVRAYGASTATAGAYSEILRASKQLATPKLTVSTKQDAGQITISWKKITGATSYELQCSVNGGDFETIATTTKLSFAHTGLTGGNTYTYRLKAKSAVSDTASAYSAVKTAVMKCAKPVVQIALNAGKKPVLTWEEVAGAEGYHVYYASSKTGKYTPMTSVTDTSYTHTVAPAAKVCYYKVVAVDGNGNEGLISSVVSITTKCLAPTGVSVSVNTKGKPVVTWNKAEGAKKYEVYVATAEDGTYKKLTTTGKLTYTYTAAKANTTYYFKITAYGASTTSRSDYSAAVKMP